METETTYECWDGKCGGTMHFQGTFGSAGERFARYLCDGCGTSSPESTCERIAGGRGD